MAKYDFQIRTQKPFCLRNLEMVQARIELTLFTLALKLNALEQHHLLLIMNFV